MENYPPPGSPVPDEDYILVLTADHASRSVPIHKSGMTIGSKPDNDVVLDDPQVAEYHARIEHKENGHYRVIDLNSITGTFLGDTRLHPGEPAEWKSNQALRIGENWLGLRLAKDEAAREEGAIPQQAVPEYDASQIHWSLGKTVGVYAGTSQLTIAPGRSAAVAAVLFNRQSFGDRIRLTVSGIPSSWVSSLASLVVVPANSERQVNVLFQVSQEPTARAGRHVVTLQVASQNMPGEQVEVTLTLTVLAYSRFASTLFPETLAPNEPAQLKIENLGNTPESFIISTEDSTGELRFVIRDEWCRINEGDSALIEVRAISPLKLWSGAAQTYPFSLQVRSAAGQVQTHAAEVMSRAMFPAWLLPVILVASVCLCAGVLMIMANTATAPTQTATPIITTASVLVDSDGDALSDADEMRLGTNPLLADTDGDGLRDGDEQRAGTNPLAVDSDGDTLADGREVFELHTSPINPDTDGDGLNDNVDPSPGQLPTPTPIPLTATWTPLPPTLTFTAPPATLTSVPPTQPPTPTAPPTVTPPPAVTVSGWIAFETRRDGNLEIYLFRADTRSELRLTNNTVDDRHLVWAPTGNRLAFDTDRDGNSEIYVMNTDGTAQTRLTNNPARDYNPVWSPDGTRLAFLSERDGNVEIYLMNADGTGQTRLTNNSSGECCPMWSPVGSLIAFMSDRAGAWGLYRMNNNGAEQSWLAAGIAAPPTWSPDGARLAFVSDRDGNAEIYIVNSDGTGEARLTNASGQDMNPVWSPDGARIAFLSNQDGNPEIYVMNPDGSALTRLTNSPTNECCLVWSPDGTQLAFVSDRDGNFEIYVLNISNLGVLRLTNNSAYDAPLAWRP